VTPGVRTWITDAVAKLAIGPDAVVTNHLDEILDNYSPNRGISSAHEVFGALTDALAPRA
jgi:hypothetical protein